MELSVDDWFPIRGESTCIKAFQKGITGVWVGMASKLKAFRSQIAGV